MNKLMLIEEAIRQMGFKCEKYPESLANILYVKDHNDKTIHAIHYKVRNHAVGFWGICDTVVDYLNQLTVDYTVLLISNNKVYSLSRYDVNVIQKIFKPSKMGVYKINEYQLGIFNCGIYPFNLIA